MLVAIWSRGAGEFQQKQFPAQTNFACGLEGSPVPDNNAVKHSLPSPHSSVTPLNCSSLSTKHALGTAQDSELTHTASVTRRPGSSAYCTHFIPFGIPLGWEPSPTLLPGAYRCGYEALLYQERKGRMLGDEFLLFQNSFWGRENSAGNYSQ